VHLDDGTVLEADLVVVGIGVVPNVGWLEDAGLPLDDGVVCDSRLFAADGVVAAGDVARWHHPSLDEQLRIEHWTNAAEGGAAAARNLVAGTDAAAPYDPVPFFWSDQYQTKIQVIGLPGPDDEVVVVEGSPEAAKLVALYRRGDRLRAALALSQPRQLMAYRPLLEAGASFDEALSLSAG
jgi:NADPH-dependent 2,4-dienoyl-CoA reductase/sulfur reductase-like enzyme